MSIKKKVSIVMAMSMCATITACGATKVKEETSPLTRESLLSGVPSLEQSADLSELKVNGGVLLDDGPVGFYKASETTTLVESKKGEPFIAASSGLQFDTFKVKKEGSIEFSGDELGENVVTFKLYQKKDEADDVAAIFEKGMYYTESITTINDVSTTDKEILNVLPTPTGLLDEDGNAVTLEEMVSSVEHSVTPISYSMVWQGDKNVICADIEENPVGNGYSVNGVSVYGIGYWNQVKG